MAEPEQHFDSIEDFMINIRKMSEERIQKIQRLSKKIWEHVHWTPIELQNKCLDAWDGIAADLETKILPLIPVIEGQPVTNLIFGSGGFDSGVSSSAISTGKSIYRDPTGDFTRFSN